MFYLQIDSFTLSIQDILVLPDADRKRSKICKKSQKSGKESITKALGLGQDVEPSVIVAEMEKAMTLNPKIRSIIDREYKSNSDVYTNQINKLVVFDYRKACDISRMRNVNAMKKHLKSCVLPQDVLAGGPPFEIPREQPPTDGGLRG